MVVLLVLKTIHMVIEIVSILLVLFILFFVSIGAVAFTGAFAASWIVTGGFSLVNDAVLIRFSAAVSALLTLGFVVKAAMDAA